METATSGSAQAPAAKPAKSAATRAPRPAARPAPKRELVSFRRGQEFAMVFSCPRRFVPEGIQVISESGGGGQGTRQEQVPEVRYNNAKLDLVGLLARCVVGIINVRENSKGYCRVYVNCTAGVKPEEIGKAGLYHWMGGAYEGFVRKQLALIYKRAIVREVGGKMFVEMRKVLDIRDADTIVRFAIED